MLLQPVRSGLAALNGPPSLGDCIGIKPPPYWCSGTKLWEELSRQPIGCMQDCIMTQAEQAQSFC